LTGFRHDPLAVVNLIADNLRDRYSSGFPVFRELIQNADDACATAVEFVVLDGIPDASNPLLRGPALACTNDGAFRNEHARAIIHMGLSSKAGEETSIGKFGLGQKAVFHLCEAFFFLASPGEELEDTDFPRANVVDPWADEKGDQLFPEWNTFPTADRRRIVERLSPIIGGLDRWFVLWLPLRTAAHRRRGRGVIVDHDPSLDRIDVELRDVTRLAELLPLLQYVRKIRYHRAREQGGSLELQGTVILDGGTQRLARGEEVADTRLALYGSIGTQISGEPICRHVFAGAAEELQKPIFQELKRNVHWPRTYMRDRHTGEAIEVSDKAVAQAAAVLVRSPRSSTGCALSVRWAVYLPVGEDPSLVPTATLSANYALLLHGCYFLDAGRQRIEGLNVQTEFSAPNDEAELRTQWNVQLRDLGTLVLVPEALAHFQDRHRPSREEITELCCAIRTSEIFRSHEAAICKQKSFVLRAAPAGIAWHLISAEAKVRWIPTPPEGATHRPWAALPGLAQMAQNAVLSPHGAPNIRSTRAADGWTAADLADVIASTSSATLERRANVAYLASLLELADPSRRFVLEIAPILQRLLRSSILDRGVRSLTQNAEQVRRLINWIMPESVLFLSLPRRTTGHCRNRCARCGI
jgi:hypothetical protein